MTLSVNLFAPTFDRADSYGRVSCELSDGLERLGVNVLRWGHMGPSLQHVGALPMGGFVLGIPNRRLENPLSQMGVRVAVTMFEMDRLPSGWVNTLNQMAAVVVPCQHNHLMFRRVGVKAPIHVVHLGISEAYTAQPPLLRQRPQGGEPLTFLAIADRGLRKNWHKVASAFVAAFGDDMRYRLILKARDIPLHITNPNIQVISETYNDEQMAALYRRCHVMVFPSSGEGFGLPPREFVATGGVAIATNWSGTAEDIPRWGVALPYDGFETGYHDIPQYVGAGKWAKVNTEDIATVVLRVANYYEEFSVQAMKGAFFVRDRYRWSNFVERCWQVYQGAAKGNAHGAISIGA